MVYTYNKIKGGIKMKKKLVFKPWNLFYSMLWLGMTGYVVYLGRFMADYSTSLSISLYVFALLVFASKWVV